MIYYQFHFDSGSLSEVRIQILHYHFEFFAVFEQHDSKRISSYC